MSAVFREFTDKPAERAGTPLLLGVAGPSGSGKTYSALRLAVGMQQVIGGDIFGIDTEHKRMLAYADRFKFRHVDFEPPFGPLDYLAAIEHCVKKGAKIIVIDNLTDEHAGPGGVMDQSEKYLDEKAGGDENERLKLFMASLKEPKRQRKQLNNRIVQLGINAVFCYRANDAVKPVPGKGIEHLGWTPETTSKLIYALTQCFLLAPGSDGKPIFKPATKGERLLVKHPEQFRDWFKDGIQLDEEAGRRMAEWASGPVAAEPPPPPPDLPDAWRTWGLQERGDNRAAAGKEAFRTWWRTLKDEEKATALPFLGSWKDAAK